MYCAQCGTSNESGGATCDVCGAPLTERTGPERCPSCDASISVYDRHCQTCGAPLTGPEAARYEPGPSFVDDTDLPVDPATLPPWLRDVVEAPVGAEQPVPEALNGEQLPEWLQATRPDFVPPSPIEPVANAVGAAPAEELSLIGEDDLPEWLRALGDDDPAAPASAEQSAPAPAPVATTEVPRVSRAWLERPRAVDPADIASARQQFAPLDSGAPVAAAAPAPAAPAPAEPAPPASPAPPVDVAPPTTDADRRKRRVRILILLLALAVLALLLILYFGGGLQ